MTPRNDGSLSLYDTTLSIWEEPAHPEGQTHGLWHGYEQEFTKTVFTPLRGYLRRRGWTVVRDPRGQHYKCIAKWMWLGNHGDLQVKLQLGGRHIEIAFFQNVVHENPNGGQYDYDRLDKMPYLVRLRFLAEMKALIEYLQTKHGYAGPQLAGREEWPLALRIARTARYGKNIRPTEDPLGSFNDGWDSEWEKRRGTHRFERDETGWPTAKELRSWDYHGITPGCERCWIHYSGHIFRGRAYPDMNGMCVFVYGKNPRDYTQVGSWELFTPKPGQSLRKVARHRCQSTVKRLLDQAVKDQNFEKAIIYRNILKQFPEVRVAA